MTRTLVRLLVFSALWIVLFTVHSIRRGDHNVGVRITIFSASLIPTIAILLLLQHLTRYRLIWVIEFLAIPFVALAMITAAAAVRAI